MRVLENRHGRIYYGGVNYGRITGHRSAAGIYLLRPHD